MAEESTNIPILDDIPDFLQNQHWFEVETNSLYLDFTKPYKPPRWTLSHDGIPFAKLGDLHVISGKAGHGKTALMTQFMACLLAGQFGHLKKELQGDVKVLYIDTEQSEDDTIAIKNRVCTMAGLPYDQPCDNFKIVRLRDTEEANDRWRQILKVIWEQKPTVCFLDGMLDIVEDYNDQKECQPIIRMCMKLVTHYNMSMWAVLHENPMADKMVGTLGSITQRKVTEAFAVRKHKHENTPNMPDIYFEVIQPKSRGRDTDEWCFEVVSAESWGMPVELDSNGRVDDPIDRKEKEFITEADERFKKLAWTSSGLSRSDVDKYLTNQGVTSNRRRGDLINKGLEKGIIYKTGDKTRPKYYYKGLNKPLPNDEAETLPFDKADNKDLPF